MIINLTLTIEDVDTNIAEFILVSSCDTIDGKTVWSRTESDPPGPDYALRLKTYLEENRLKVEIEQKGKKILNSQNEIIDLFLEAYLNSKFQQQIDQADGIEHEHENGNAEIHEVDKDPYDPKLIRVDTRPFSIRQVIDMIRDGDLDLSPDFQRQFVWLDITRKSRLIESLLLRIPLPVFYLAQDEDGRFRVVDGVQRLTVIRDYIENKFKLKNLEYLTDCEGKWYRNQNREPNNSLDQLYVRRIDQTQLYFNIIDPQTPEKVKYDIFRRINTGGKSLNRQEIRNCLEKQHVREFIKMLASSEEFLLATKHSISPTRMADHEIILRFIAFYLLDKDMYNQIAYKGDMDTYLDHTIDLLNKISIKEFDCIEEAFKRAMSNAYYLFGNRAFRKSNYINKSLFLSWSRVLCDMDLNELKEQDLYPRLLEKLGNEILNNNDYSQALSMATNDVRNVELSFKIATKLLEESYNNE